MSADDVRQTRRAIEELAPASLYLSYHAAYAAFDWALNVGLVTQAEYYAAKRHYGNLWFYVGD